MFEVVRPVATTTDTLVSTNVALSESAWSAVTTYSVDQVAYRPVDGLYRRFISLVGSNLNNDPATDDGTNWLDDGPVNRHAMFDETVSTVTTNADSIAVEIEIPATERLDVLYLAGLDAVSVRVEVDDPIDGPGVYDETFSLADMGAITDWWAWYTDPVSYMTELLVTDLPSGAGVTLRVTITKTGDIAGCGALVTGLRKAIGYAQWGWSTEIRDYSVFTEDAFGNRTLTPRNYRKLASGPVLIENRIKDSVERLLTEGRASVRLYIVNDEYTSLVILGTIRWQNEMSLPPAHSLCSAQLESVV